MKITQVKNTFKVHFENKYPNKEELLILNNKNMGEYWVDTSRSYSRVLSKTGVFPFSCTMECPINEYFRM